MSRQPEYGTFVVRPDDLGEFMIGLVDAIHECSELLDQAVDYVRECRRKSGDETPRDRATIEMFANFTRKVLTAYTDLERDGERVKAEFGWPF